MLRCAVVSFVPSGMERVLPRGASTPALGQTVHVLAGEPIPVADILESLACGDMSDSGVHQALADRVGGVLRSLQAELETSLAGQV